MLIDMHSHILPGIDDGSQNLEESIKLLDLLAKNHVDVVVATPHFYIENQSISDFIKNRNKAYEKLKPHLKSNHPKILLGAEILYSPLLVSNELLYDLKIQGTDYILLEIPYSKITNEIIENVEKISYFMDVKIIIAHIERYLHFTSFKSLTKLMDLDVLGQINVKSLKTVSSRRNCVKLAKMDYVHALGSDIHRIKKPVPLVSDAAEVLDKKLGDGYTNHLMKNEVDILKNVDIEHFF